MSIASWLKRLSNPVAVNWTTGDEVPIPASGTGEVLCDQWFCGDIVVMDRSVLYA